MLSFLEIIEDMRNQVKILVRLSELDFEISMLSLHTLIGLSLDIISKCLNILSKPTEPKFSSVTLPSTRTETVKTCCRRCIYIYI